MFTKAIITFCAALTLTTSLVSVADAQSRKQAVQPFTAAEQNWFDLATGRDDGMPRQ